MKIIACDQRSAAWFDARCGVLTGSRVADAFATLKKGGEAIGRKKLRLQLALERITGKPIENGYVSFAMQRGIELEAEARAAYEAETGRLVEAVGFCRHDELMAGCSPDGLTAEGGIEIKCPELLAHHEYLAGGLPHDYFLQCVHGLWITGRTWWDFVSYQPDFPPDLRIKITRVWAKDIDFAAHELAVRLFLSEVETAVGELHALRSVPA